MTNIYNDHLDKLIKINKSEDPAISLFIPLKWEDLSPQRIFSALVKTANNLLEKDGYLKLNLETPSWEQWAKQGTITLAIFHQNGLTHIIPLPTRMQPRVIVAKSFHVKPIVTASHEYVDALLLHFSENGGSLFRVHPAGEFLIDSYLPSEIVPKSNWPHRLDRQQFLEFMEFLAQEIKGYIKPSTKFLAITGTGYPELRSELCWKKIKLPIFFYDELFKIKVPKNTLSAARLKLSEIIHEIHLKNVLNTLHERDWQGHNNLKQLAPKILKKEITKLCVSLDCMQFGFLDKSTGEVVMNKSQQNSSDDDILDDLIELAIERGIEISVVPKKFLPHGRSFVAS